MSRENKHYEWMSLALDLARKAEASGDVPVGAVIVNENNQLVSKGYNKKEKIPSPLGHAELMAIHRASKKLNNWRLSNCTLYVTLEPCAMCAGAIVHARLKKVYFATPDPKSGALGSVFSIHNENKLNHQFEVESGLLAEEASSILKKFFKQRRDSKTKKN